MLAEREGMRATLPLSLARSYPEEMIGDRVTYETYETYKARFLANDPTCYAFLNRALMTVDLSHEIENIRCPTLVLAGSHDLVRPSTTVAELARALPAAQFEILNGGHLLPVQSPRPLLASVLHFFTVMPSPAMADHPQKTSIPLRREDA